MIESVSINGVATYKSGSPEVLNELSKINFLYGSNGAGKTTISKIIANELDFLDCEVTWKEEQKMQTLVYNKDFIDKNFNQSPGLKGVFTLGEGGIEVLKEIDLIKDALEELKSKNNALKGTLEEKKNADRDLEEGSKKKFWDAYLKYKDGGLVNAFEGFKGDKNKFKNKVLTESESNKSALQSLEDLKSRAEKVFSSDCSSEDLLPKIEDKITVHESNPILKKKVVGKSDVDIAKMIKALDNGNWVKEGKDFYEKSKGKCPFCQQSINESFSDSLSEYFDETFKSDMIAIDDLCSIYEIAVNQLLKEINSVVRSESRFLKTEMLTSKKDLLDQLLRGNIATLAKKKKEPGSVLYLKSAVSTIREIKCILDEANNSILENNKIIDNLGKEKEALKSGVWKYIVEKELGSDIESHLKEKECLKKAIESIESQIKNTENKIAEKNNKLIALQKNTTSIEPTINSINHLLESYGFHGFNLKEAGDNLHYKLVRPDGLDAKETLSEGERTFVTFLYFYHLLKGGDLGDGVLEDRVIVFDDPVSSLDSDILFIVSSLIRDIFKDVSGGEGCIKQVFILTHNVYFYKEVSYHLKSSSKHYSFWTVRKFNSFSKLEKHDKSPILTSYEMLWREIGKDLNCNLTIQNTLRRILESYFKILGGCDLNDLISNFKDKDSLICRSLLPWVQDGSHGVYDDIYISNQNVGVEKYLTIFEEIFKHSGHINHYKMMMKKS